MNEFLAKPVRPQELRAALRRVGETKIQATQSSASVRAGADLDGSSSEQHRAQMRSLHAAYMEDARTTIDELQSLALANDFHNLQRKAHYLKGSSLVVGALEIGKVCKKIEDWAAAKRPVISMVEELHRCLANASIELELVPKAGE
jgi:HPt (histidine-containing phosphotransfer) domain-containing protein